MPPAISIALACALAAFSASPALSAQATHARVICAGGFRGVAVDTSMSGSPATLRFGSRPSETPIERPDPEAMRELAAALESHDPAVNRARMRLLADYDIIKIEKGGMGTTIVVKPKGRTGPVRRLKSPLNSLGAEGRAAFAREARLANLAGRAGLGPTTTWARELGMMVMNEVPGMNFGRFRTEVLEAMPAGERDAWMEKFVVDLSANVAKLHALGIVHLDLKPENIMIVDGKPLFIDFGVSLEKGELEKTHRDLAGRPHPGSEFFQGKHARRGKPTFADDFESVKVIVDNMLRPSASDPIRTQRRDRPFFKERPLLRSLMTLLAEPSERELADAKLSETTAILFAIAAKKDPSAGDRKTFWEAFHARLDLRTDGQKLRVIFRDPALHGDPAIMGRWSNDALKTLIDNGTRENNWSIPSGDRNSVADAAEIRRASFWSLRVVGGSVDFDALRSTRESLGGLPKPPSGGFSMEL